MTNRNPDLELTPEEWEGVAEAELFQGFHAPGSLASLGAEDSAPEDEAAALALADQLFGAGIAPDRVSAEDIAMLHAARTWCQAQLGGVREPAAAGTGTRHVARSRLLANWLGEVLGIRPALGG
jgi:hypothetical protein